MWLAGVARGLACTWVYKRRHNTPLQTHTHTSTGRLAGRNPTTTFSAFPGSPSLLFVYTVPLGWLNNVQEQPLQLPNPFHFPPFLSIRHCHHRAANHSAANVLSVLLSPFVIAAREDAAKERKRSRRRWNELIDRANRKRNTQGIRSIFFACKLN